MKTLDSKTLEHIIRPAVEGQGYEFVELAWSRGVRGSGVLRVTIDRPIGQGHISHSDCVRVSREVSALLDVHDPMPGGRYQLEISSPGVDRPLKRGVDFLRFVGQRAKVRLRPDAMRSDVGPAATPPPDSKVGPRRVFAGEIEAVDGELVQMQADGVGKVVLHTADMEKANLLFAFNA
jgi:ribosome maturation factor RimP